MKHTHTSAPLALFATSILCVACSSSPEDPASVVLIPIEQTTLRCAGADPEVDGPDACDVARVTQLEVTCSAASAGGAGGPGGATACSEQWGQCDDGHLYAVDCATVDGALSCTCSVDGEEVSAFSPEADFCQAAELDDDESHWIERCEFRTTSFSET